MEPTIRIIACPCCKGVLYTLRSETTVGGRGPWRLGKESPAIKKDQHGNFMICPRCAKHIDLVFADELESPGFRVAEKENDPNSMRIVSMSSTTSVRPASCQRRALRAWMERDGTALDEERAALARMVKRVEFDPATGERCIDCLIAATLDAGRFSIRNAAELGVGRKLGFTWRPHGKPPLNPPSSSFGGCTSGASAAAGYPALCCPAVKRRANNNQDAT